MKLVADLKADHSAFRREFLKQPVRHVAGNVIELAQPVVRGDKGVGAQVDRLRNGVVRCMRNVNDHAETVCLANPGASPIVQAVPLGRCAARVRVVALPVVGGQLHGAEPQAVEIAHYAEVAVEIEASLNVEHGRDSARLVNSLDLGRVMRDFDGGAVVPDLPDTCVDQPQRLLGFKAARIVILGYVEREEHGADSTFAGARKIELAIRFSLADVTSVIKLTLDRVDVRIENQSFLV